MSKNVIGRGLDALLPTNEDKQGLELPVESLAPNPFQPRHDFSQIELEDLAASIKEHGLLQPVVVRKVGSTYQIIMGERRWRASQLAGFERIPVIVREADDNQALILALVENVQREDLNPIEQAKAYERLAREFNLNQESIARLVGKDRSTVANIIRLLDLSTSIQEMVIEKRLSAGHARAILSISSDSMREVLAKRASKQDMSVRDIEKAVQKLKHEKQKTVKVDQNIKELEEKLSRVLSTKVSIQLSGRRGKIVLSFFNLDELERLSQRLSD
jgi:ParB family transcriptional regulator, chromosome partitioning protein